MPKIAQTIGDVNVRSHTFHFVSLALTASQKVPNACNTCHRDKSTQWAIDTLKTWGDRSPWRVAQQGRSRAVCGSAMGREVMKNQRPNSPPLHYLFTIADRRS